MSYIDDSWAISWETPTRSSNRALLSTAIHTSARDDQCTCTSRMDCKYHCTLHGYHMYTTWVSHVHHIGITCTPHGYHMYTTWVSHVHYMGITITCTPHGYYLYTTWSLDRALLSTAIHTSARDNQCTCTSRMGCKYHLYTAWVSHVHHMGITCTPHGYTPHDPLAEPYQPPHT